MKKEEITKSEKVKEQILFAAKRELAEKGFNGARMSSIALNAKTTKSLIYYYFQSKENLFVKVLDRIFGMDVSQIEEYFDDYLQSNDLLPQEKLHIAIYFLVKIHFTSLDPDLQKIMYHGTSEKRDEITKIITNYFIPRLGKLEQIIIDGIDLGVFETSYPILIVINLVVFMMTFEGNKHIFINSPWRDVFSHEGYRQNIENYLVENTFKALKPDGKELKIPEIPEKTKKLMDLLIIQVQESQEWRVD